MSKLRFQSTREMPITNEPSLYVSKQLFVTQSSNGSKLLALSPLRVIPRNYDCNDQTCNERVIPVTTIDWVMAAGTIGLRR